MSNSSIPSVSSTNIRQALGGIPFLGTAFGIDGASLLPNTLQGSAAGVSHFAPGSIGATDCAAGAFWGAPVWADTGATNGIVVTPLPAPTSLTGLQVLFVAGHTNTGACTLTCTGLSSKGLTKMGNTALVAGDLIAGAVYLAAYDGTRFQVVNLATGSPWLSKALLSDTGVADASALTPSPAITAYAAGQSFRFVVAASNATTTPTVAISGLAAKTITKQGANALAAGDLLIGAVVEIVYDGTHFQVLNPVVT